MLGGLVLACNGFVPFSDVTLLGAAVASLCGIVALGFLAYSDSRARGQGFLRSLGEALRDGGRSFLLLFP